MQEPVISEELAALPEIMVNAISSYSTVDGKVHLFGGYMPGTDPYQAYDNVWSYDLSAGTWDNLAVTLPYGVFDYQSTGVFYDQHFYLSPGFATGNTNGWGSHNKIIDVDLESGSATETLAFSSNWRIWNIASVMAGSKIYYFGGHTGSDMDEIFEFDPEAGTLDHVATMSFRANNLSATLGGDGWIYYWAPYDSEKIERFNPTTHSVETMLAELPYEGRTEPTNVWHIERENAFYFFSGQVNPSIYKYKYVDDVLSETGWTLSGDYRTKMQAVKDANQSDVLYAFQRTGPPDTNPPVLTRLTLTGDDPDELIAYYPFDGDARDVTGNGYDGTVNGATLTTDRFGNPSSAYGFDGTDDYIDVTALESALEMQQEGSISLWFKVDDLSEGRALFYFSHDEPESIFGTRTFLLMIADGKLRAMIRDSAINGSYPFFAWDVRGSTVVTEGEWHHVVITHDGTAPTLYLDNTEESLSYEKDYDRTTWLADIDPRLNEAGIGRYSYSGYDPLNYFDGKIDDVRVFGRALSIDEVEALHGTQYIAGRILDSESNEGIEGAQVHLEQNPERATTTAANGSYRLYVAPGTGYTLDATAENYFEGSRTYVDLFPNAPTTGINIRLDPASSATPVVRALTPDPNPTPSTVEEGGTAYRHYRVIDRDTKRALSGQTVTVASIDDDEVTYTAQSGPDGVVKVPIPSTDVGAAGASRDFEIVGFDGETISQEARPQFTVEVTDRISNKSWSLRSFGRLGIGLGIGADATVEGEGALTGRVSLGSRSSEFSPASQIRLWRRARGDLGVSVGVGSPLNTKIGSASIGGGARIGAGAFFFGGDAYDFEYKDELSSAESAAQYAVWARGNALLVSSNLLRLFNTLVAQGAPDAMEAALQSDERGYGGRKYGSASFEAGVGAPRSLGVGVKAGVGASAELFVRKRALSASVEEVSANARVEVTGGVNAGARFFDDTQKDEAGPKARKDLGEDYKAYLNLVSAGGKLAALLRVGATCDNLSPTSFFTEIGVEATGNLSALGLASGTYELSRLNRRYEFNPTSSVLPAFSGNAADPTVRELISSCTGSAALTFGSLTYRNLSDYLFNALGDRQADLSFPPITYEQDSTVVETSQGFEIDLSGSIGVKAAVGAGVDFLESKSAISERGRWVNGTHYPTESYTSIPDIPVEYKTVVRRILTGLDDAVWSAALTLWEAIKPPYLDQQLATKSGVAAASINYPIGDNGTTVSFSEGAIPSSVDSVWAASWGWWGKSATTRPSSLTAKARRVMTATKQVAEEAYGMRYGIGGFYELQPADTGLEAPTTLTIHYSEQELDGVDESELAVYWEDVLNGRWRYLGGTVDAVNNTVSVQIDTLRTFTLAPRLPAQPFDLTSDVDALPADSNNTVTVTSATLINNDSTTVADGALYTVETDRGRIASPDADTTRPGVQVPASGGQLTFDLQAGTIPGTARVQARSVYGRSEGETTVTLQNVAPPPETQIASAQARDNAVRLRWNGVDESDLGGYRIYFGTDSTQYEGIAAGGQASPITAGEANKAVIEGLPNDSTFFFAVAPYDVAGAEADRSAAVAATPVDAVAPGKPLNLRPTLQADTLAVLAWTAPGDNGREGLAYAYEVRYDAVPVGSDTSAWWDAATPADVTQPPAEAGAEESVPIRGGFSGEVYYGVRAIDEMGNASPIHVTNTAELPVELAAFDATLDGRAVTLAWKTLSEENNAGFEVQRRIGTEDFQRIGYVEGAGTTTQSRSYQFEDAAMPFEVKEVTYRLKQVDYGGAFEYSPEVEVTIDAPDELALHGNYPNPFRERTTIRYELPKAGDVRIDVYNVLGQRVATLVDERKEAGREEAVFDARRLASGVYFVRLRVADETRVEKITVVR
jgi:hypothetical protein